jgi:UV DNA damage endonuclease
MSNIRWGLCCQFLDAPIRFRTATHRYVASLTAERRRAYLSDVVGSNAIALAHAVERCHELGIGAFRVNSQVVPLATHPVSGYTLDDLEPAHAIRRAWVAAGELARARGVRLSFHPDQFVVLNSEREEVVASSIRELEHQAVIAELIGADVLCLHVGGVTGGVEAAVARFERGLERVSGRVRERLAIENDDRLFSPREIHRLHERTGLPFIYDAHHHRCHPDGLTVDRGHGADGRELERPRAVRAPLLAARRLGRVPTRAPTPPTSTPPTCPTPGSPCPASRWTSRPRTRSARWSR